LSAFLREFRLFTGFRGGRFLRRFSHPLFQEWSAKAMKNATRVHQRGFSLVEVAVATMLFSMGLGSLSIMLMTAVHGTTESRHQTMAAMQADSLAEMVVMSSDAYGHYVYDNELYTGQCAAENCASSEVAAANLIDWQDRLSRELPGGTGLVCRDSTPDDGSDADPLCDGNGALVVKIFWSEPGHSDAENKQQMRVVSRLAW
jgi:type IV pilus assembly protein PilV